MSVSSATDLEPPVGEVILDKIAKSYDGPDGPKEVVSNCSCRIRAGELTVMIGPSGCGKSTLASLIAGFELPTEGDISVDGQPVQGPGRDRLMLFQETALFPWMSTLDNVLFGPRARNEMDSSTRAVAELLLGRFGLSGFALKYPDQLSGGMQRRAELARATINRPKIMILDEPFRGLDAMTRHMMWEYYASLSEEYRQTRLFITTDIDEALYLADTILIMSAMPTKVREIMKVNVPRPRKRSSLLENDEMNAIKMKALSLLHEETMKSFSHNSKAAANFVTAFSERGTN